MGNTASSTSKMTNTQQAYISAVQNTTNNSIAAAYNSTVLSFRNVSGDVNLEGINVNQVAKSTATAQFKNTNDANILQKVSASLENQASSLVKGIGLGNSSRSNAVINNYVNSTMDLSQQITNNCSANATNVFDISVDKVGGSVNVKDITVSQGADAMLKCMADNEQKIVAKQEQIVEASNKSSAASIGVSGFGLIPFIIAVVAVFVVMIGGVLGIAKTMGKNLTDPRLIGIVTGIFLILSGISMAVKSATTKIEYQPADCDAITDEYNKQQQQQKKTNFIIKPFFFTCGIYGKGTNCSRLFNPPVIVGAFTTTSAPINPSTTGGTNACTFAIHDLTKTTFNDVSDAYTAFLITDDCKGLDVLYSLDGRVQYIFYKEVSRMCYRALYSDVNQEIALWDGKTAWSNIPRNPLYPPLTCSVLPCIEGDPSTTDTLNRPYYIRISRNGYVYYFKNNAWIRVNPTSFWVTANKTAPPLTNMLVYRGSPDRTPDLLSVDKNPLVDPQKPVAYFDINAVSNGSYFDLYWKEVASSVATDAMQGFTKIGTIDCSVMSNDGVVAFGPNPLLNYMNRTWVKIYDVDADKDILSDDEKKMDQSASTSTKDIGIKYLECQDKYNKWQTTKKNNDIFKYVGIGLIPLGLIVMMGSFFARLQPKDDLSSPSLSPSSTLTIR